MKKIGIIFNLIVGILFFTECSTDSGKRQLGINDIQIVISPAVPTDVTAQDVAYPDNVTMTDMAIFAWQEFIAYNFPVDPEIRGQYKEGSKFGDEGPLVWETFWHRNEIFRESMHWSSDTFLDGRLKVCQSRHGYRFNEDAAILAFPSKNQK